jgi:hypothetical protein
MLVAGTDVVWINLYPVNKKKHWQEEQTNKEQAKGEARKTRPKQRDDKFKNIAQ